MAIKQTFFSLLLMLFTTVTEATTVFLDSGQFNASNSGLITFDGDQGTIAGINTYLGQYNAQLIVYSGSYLGTARITDDLRIANPISGVNFLGGGEGPGSWINLYFNSPVSSVGAFLSGWEGIHDPYLGAPGGLVTVTLGNGSTIDYSPTSYLGAAGGLNGFMGIQDLVSGISEVRFIWNRDIGALDNIYFSNTQPNNHSIPEPISLILLGSGLLSLIQIKKYQNYKTYKNYTFNTMRIST